MKTIEEANDIVFRNVEGWVGDRVWTILQCIRDDQKLHRVSGSIAEIGVHHGMLFFILSHVGDEDTQLLAIDLFDDQGKNLDLSGRGSKTIFQNHIATLFPELSSRVRIISTDSMSITALNRVSIFPEPVRLFSVDGGHTVQHVVNDLMIAQDVLSPRGTVLLDDFFGPQWPSVSEGFFRYFEHHNVRLAPYLVFQNKLFLTTYSEQSSVWNSVNEYVEKNMNHEILVGRWRHSQLCGYKVMCFA